MGTRGVGQKRNNRKKNIGDAYDECNRLFSHVYSLAKRAQRIEDYEVVLKEYTRKLDELEQELLIKYKPLKGCSYISVDLKALYEQYKNELCEKFNKLGYEMIPKLKQIKHKLARVSYGCN